MTIKAARYWPVRPKRNMFHERDDYLQALQVWALVRRLRQLGESREQCEALLSEFNGGFIGWDFFDPNSEATK